MDTADKQLVASVLERGRRRRDEDDLTAPKDELDEGAAPDDGLAVAGELGVEVALDDAEKTPWEEPPAKLNPEVAEEPTAEELDAIAADMIGIDDIDGPFGECIPEIVRIAFVAQWRVARVNRAVGLVKSFPCQMQVQKPNFGENRQAPGLTNLSRPHRALGRYVHDVDGRASRFANPHGALRRNLLRHNRPALGEVLTLQRTASFGHHPLLRGGHDARVFAMQHREKTGCAGGAD